MTDVTSPEVTSRRENSMDEKQKLDASVDEDEASVEGHAAINFRPLEPGPGNQVMRKPTHYREPRTNS